MLLAARVDTVAGLQRELEDDVPLPSPSVLYKYARGEASPSAQVTIGPRGVLQVHRGLIREEDRKQAASRLRSQSVNQYGEKPAARAHSEPLMRKLTAHRTIALQAVLAQSTHVALASLAHCLVERLILNELGAEFALEIQAHDCCQD
jgi:hypothetical protein